MIALDDEDPLVRHIQVVAGNRSLNGSAQAFRIDAVPVPGLTEPITVAVELGESSKSVDDLLEMRASDSKTSTARELILDILDREGDQQSDVLDARVARKIGLAVRTVQNIRVRLSKHDGLTKNYPRRTSTAKITRWFVGRTGAPRS